MRIATWNVNSVVARLPRLIDWLGAVEPDVVCLQELKTGDFPVDEVAALGYEVATHSAGRWNGVAILSRVGVADIRRGLVDEPGFQPADAMLAATEARAVGATCGGLRVWSVYVPNGREVGHPHYAYKLEWLAALRETAAAELATWPAFAVLGDFNIAPGDADVWDPAAFATSTHVTAPERAALTALRDLGLRDVLPRALKHDTPYTYWDYRAGMFHKNMGMRIDLVYAAAPVADAVADAYVDRDARKGKGPSDHAPVAVDLDLPAPAA
ncbi:exodeoxyribonuclease III [uncultured Jatrophihabitans sp.]|uniref:exodeoxyribonuclease III n=1 Tax=uncultured Jatrophihabitans sp. TaxID=1610747 RepID=UPI0035C9EE20